MDAKIDAINRKLSRLAEKAAKTSLGSLTGIAGQQAGFRGFGHFWTGQAGRMLHQRSLF